MPRLAPRLLLLAALCLAAPPLPAQFATPRPYGSRNESRRERKPAPTPKPQPESKPEAAPQPPQQPGARGGAVNNQPQQRNVRTKTATRSAPSGSSGAEAPTFEFPPGSVQACLFLRPMDLYLRPGQDFRVELLLRNSSNRLAESFEITLHYEPQWLTLRRVDPSEIGPQLATRDDGSTLTLETPPGRLRMAGRLQEGDRRGELLFARLHFTAAALPGKTTLRFATPPEGRCQVLADNGDSLLGNADRNLHGLLNSHVFILENPEQALPPGDTPSTATRIDLDTATPEETVGLRPELEGWSRLPAEARPQEPVWLLLQGPEDGIVRVGEPFWVDVALVNGSLAPIGSVGLRLAFDPEVLEVLDEDRGNWIVRGTNGWDGAFHENYPFDFHAANAADNDSGTFEYRAARTAEAWPFPTGVFLRLRLKAKAPAAETGIRMLRHGRGKSPGSYVRAWGIDRLDQTWDPAAPPALRLRVLPALGETGPDA